MKAISVVLVGLALTTSGCILTYTVRVTNESPAAVMVELTQYHSAKFDSERPTNFTDDLKVRTEAISLLPRQETTLKFKQLGSGVWVQWCVVETSHRKPCGVIDLVRDQLQIDIK